jgi:hypothetical protein
MNAEDLAFAVGEGGKRLRPKAAQGLAAAPAGLDQARGAEAPHVPADERLRQAHVLDEVPNRRVARREAPDDAEPVDVGEGLVHDPQLAEIIGLVDDRGERRPDSGAGGAQGDVLASTAVYINES